MIDVKDSKKSLTPRKLVIYIHGKGGSASESEHYIPLFPGCKVVGFDYAASDPREAQKEFSGYYDAVSRCFDFVYLVANSIGAFFSLCSLTEKRIEKAFFISPVVDMERLITNMMSRADVAEDELREKKEIATLYGETLSWEYLEWVRAHPIHWEIPTAILYGGRDNLQTKETIYAFAARCRASVTLMENGEHWFHTDEQMSFLDEWIRKEYGTVF